MPVDSSLLKEKITKSIEMNLFSHIITFDERHYNGYILKQDDTHILFDDRIEGETLIAISDIKRLEKSTVHKEVSDGGK